MASTINTTPFTRHASHDVGGAAQYVVDSLPFSQNFVVRIINGDPAQISEFGHVVEVATCPDLGAALMIAQATAYYINSLRADVPSEIDAAAERDASAFLEWRKPLIGTASVDDLCQQWLDR